MNIAKCKSTLRKSMTSKTISECNFLISGIVIYDLSDLLWILVATWQGPAQSLCKGFLGIRQWSNAIWECYLTCRQPLWRQHKDIRPEAKNWIKSGVLFETWYADNHQNRSSSLWPRKSPNWIPCCQKASWILISTQQPYRSISWMVLVSLIFPLKLPIGPRLRRDPQHLGWDMSKQT